MPFGIEPHDRRTEVMNPISLAVQRTKHLILVRRGNSAAIRGSRVCCIGFARIFLTSSSDIVGRFESSGAAYDATRRRSSGVATFIWCSISSPIWSTSLQKPMK